MNSPLRLDEYFFEDFSLKVTPSFDPKSKVGKRKDGKIHCKEEYGPAKLYPKRFRIAISILVEPSKEPPARDPYFINFRIIGLFSFIDGVPKNIMDQMVRLNGTSILYGIARGTVSSVAAISQHGKYILQALNFVQMFKSIEEGQQAKVADDQKTVRGRPKKRAAAKRQ